MNDRNAADPPLTRAQLRARLQEASAAGSGEMSVGTAASPAPVVAQAFDPARMFDPVPAPAVAEPSLDTNPFTAALRDPIGPPSAERPAFVGEPSFVGAAGRFEVETSDVARAKTTNGPAKTALVLILVALLGAFAAYGLAIAGHAAIGGWVFVSVSGVFGASFVLSVVGLVLAIRRATQKLEPVFALVVSLLAVIGAGGRILGVY